MYKALYILTPYAKTRIIKLTTRPRQNGYGRQNVRLYVHRGAAAKMLHFIVFLKLHASPLCSFSLFFFIFSRFPFFSFFLFFFFPFFAAPLGVPPGANRPLCPLLGTPLTRLMSDIYAAIDSGRVTILALFGCVGCV